MCDTSIVEYFSSHEGYKCGYCKFENSCFSHGMWAHTLTPLDYQNLIDRGWRRSGKYIYKPTMHRTCCPQYSIRCEVKEFTLSKSQKKVLKKVHKYLSYGEQERNVSQTSESSDHGMDVSENLEAMDAQILKDMKKVSKISRSVIETVESPNHTATSATLKQGKDVPPSSPSVKASSSESSHSNVSTVATLPAKSNSEKPCKKAKELRRERKLQKLLNKGVSAEEAVLSLQKKSSEPKTVEDFLNGACPEEPVYKLELHLVASSLENPLFIQTFEESYSVYKKYQMAIHKDRPEKCSKDQFVRFLVKNPYQRPEGSSSIYGSFHHQYWLNGKLIAVGVLDVLPYCVSSVYFYYDPDYSFLSLGTYGALREIALTRELNVQYPNLQYYYMGFYIHSCVKMRYKGQFHPSYLLCPETYIFQPLEKCIPKLNASKYSRLEEDPVKEDSDGVVNLSEVLILYNHKRLSWPAYIRVTLHTNEEELVREYAGFVGKKCYRKMLLYRN